MTSLLLACCVLGMAGPPTLPPLPGQQTPPPAPPVRSGEQTQGAAKVSEVNLPEEFRDPSSLPPKAAEDGASTEAAVVTAPDQPPASPAPGERRSDAREVTTSRNLDLGTSIAFVCFGDDGTVVRGEGVAGPRCNLHRWLLPVASPPPSSPRRPSSST